MTQSILNSIKKSLGVSEDYTAFDLDILMHVNSAFATLHQLGIGPKEGFMIDDDESTWNDFLKGDDRLNSVKTYISLKTRLLFDPPATSFTITAIQENIKELEWRLNVVREHAVYGAEIVSPGMPSPSGGVFDGGRP